MKKKRDRSNPWTSEKKGNNVHNIRFEITGAEWEQWVLLQSDEHWDNPHCDRDLLKRHHEQAIQRNAPILKAGDTLCMMAGKYDKRADKTLVRPEHQKSDYFDAIVRTAADWYEPYKDNIVLWGYGNHCTKILQIHEVDVLGNIVRELRHRGGIGSVGGYSGWVRFCFSIRKTRRLSRRLFYHHGGGADPSQSKGTLEFSRMPEKYTADIYWAGHIHQHMLVLGSRAYLNEASIVEHRPTAFVRTSTYKDEYQEGAHGFHVEKGRGPRSLGGFWIRMYFREATGVHFEFIPTDR